MTVAIALGSNIGDRHGHLRWAVEQLGTHLSNIRASSFVETEPFQVPGPQPRYLNAALTGETSLEPDELLRLLLAIEQARGRERASVRAARTLDLDLILYGDRIIDTATLVVPHPQFRERRFVLEPLAEVAPECKDPVTGRTIRELASAIHRL